MVKKLTALFGLIFFSLLTNYSYSQNVEVYPSHWWVGMKWNKVQLMVYRPEGLTTSKTAVVSNNNDISIKKIFKPDNNHYLFIDIEIAASAKPGFKNIRINNPSLSESYTIKYELKPRRSGKGTAFAQGVTSKDFVYLLMPDRFSNGDTANDRIAGMKDQSLD